MAERGDTGGLTALLGVLGARGGLVADDGAAGDLFEAADAPLPLAAKGVSGPKGGRPAGARNKSTEEWCRFLLSQYRSPLTVLAELYSRDVGELVDELQGMADKHKKWRETKDGGYWTVVQVDPLAVLKMQRDAAVALAPYLHKQQPRALEIEQRPRGMVIMPDLIADAQQADDDLALPLAHNEQNQGVGAALSVRPESGQSHAAGNASTSNGLDDAKP